MRFSRQRSFEKVGIGTASPSQKNENNVSGGTFKLIRDIAARPSMIMRRNGSDKKVGMDVSKSNISPVDKPKRKPSSAPRVVPFAPERLSIVNSINSLHIEKNATHSSPLIPLGEASMKVSPATTGVLLASVKLHNQLTHIRDREAGDHSFRKHMAEFTHEKVAARHQKVLDQYKIRTLQKPKTEDDELALAVQQTNAKCKYLISPTYKWFKAWQFIVLIVTVYQMYSIPFLLAFGNNQFSHLDWDRLGPSAIYLVDILVRFNTIIRDPIFHDRFLTRRSRIIKNYLTGWFIFDFISMLPMDSFVFYISNTDVHALELLHGLRLPRLFRLLQLASLLRILRIGPEWTQWLLYSRYSHLIRLVSLIAAFLTLTHLVACTWNGLVGKNDWIQEIVPDSDATTAYDVYILSVYISLMAMLGQSLPINSTRYFLFCSVATIIGSLVMAIVFGNVADLLANFYENNNNYKRKIESLFTSMDLMKLPEQLQHRINEYYQTMWTRYGTLDGTTNQFMRELSRNLAKEVELFLRMDMINRAPFFHGCSKKFVEEIVMELVLQVFLVGDYVIVRGEVGHDMYFVQSGICEVTKGTDDDSWDHRTSSTTGPALHPDEVVLKTLSQGDYFGEISLLMNCKRTANVRARTFTELCVLSRATFDAISSRYLEDRTSIEKFITDKYDPALLKEVLRQQEANQRGSSMAKEERDAMAANFQRVFDQLSIMEARLEVIQQCQQQTIHDDAMRLRPRSRMDDDLPQHADRHKVLHDESMCDVVPLSSVRE